MQEGKQRGQDQGILVCLFRLPCLLTLLAAEVLERAGKNSGSLVVPKSTLLRIVSWRSDQD